MKIVKEIEILKDSVVIVNKPDKDLLNSHIKYLKSMRMIPAYLSSRLKKNDIVLTLGAGDITLLGPKILKSLLRRFTGDFCFRVLNLCKKFPDFAKLCSFFT